MQYLSITNGILLITVFVSILAFYSRQLFETLKFNAWFIYHAKQLWRFLTYAFVHVNGIHLFFNMYVLFVFGRAIENHYFYLFDDSKFKAAGLYILLYLGASIVSSISDFKKHKDDSWYNSVGASGAVSAIVFSYIAFSPTASLYLLFLPIPIPAFILGALYLAYSWYMSKKNIDNIGHDAHFYGALFGFFYSFIVSPPAFMDFINALAEFFTKLF